MWKTAADSKFLDVGWNSKELQQLKREALQMLRNNFNGSYIVPSRSQYPHLWLWDACFHAIALADSDVELAKQELRALFSGQWESGLIPHIQFSGAGREHYRPDQDDWGTPRASSGVTQPPLAASAVRALYESSGDREFVAEVYPYLKKYHRWLKQARDPENLGLTAIVHPWESGTDNSPIFSAPRDRFLSIHPECGVPPRADRKSVAGQERPSDQDYRLYWGLIRQLRGLKWDQPEVYYGSPLLIWDVLFNSVWRRSNADLAALCEVIGLGEEAFIGDANQHESLSSYLLCTIIGSNFNVCRRGLSNQQLRYAPMYFQHRALT